MLCLLPLVQTRLCYAWSKRASVTQSYLFVALICRIQLFRSLASYYVFQVIFKEWIQDDLPNADDD
jgi:hypothetical protein